MALCYDRLRQHGKESLPWSPITGRLGKSLVSLGLGVLIWKMGDLAQSGGFQIWFEPWNKIFTQRPKHGR